MCAVTRVVRSSDGDAEIDDFHGEDFGRRCERTDGEVLVLPRNHAPPPSGSILHISGSRRFAEFLAKPLVRLLRVLRELDVALECQNGRDCAGEIDETAA